MKSLGLILTLAAGMGATTLAAQEVEILSLERHGVVVWTNASQCVTCRVEWASTVEGPWHGDWDSLRDIVMTSNVMARPVPRFFRVVCTPARTQWVTNISSAAALTLITNRYADPSFVILDVRTTGEYNTRHIRGAINLDFYSPTFSTELAQLSRCDAYLVYCAAGSRSGQAVAQMASLGFFEVYNMLGGFNSFTSVPGSGDWLEP